MRPALAVAISLAALNGSAAQQDSPEFKILKRWTGTWKTEFVNKVTELNPKETRTTGTVTCKPVLGGKFIEEVGSSLGKGVEHSVIWGYDPQKKAYRYWFFDSTGTTGDGVGAWDETSRTMTWKTETGPGFTGTAIHRFLDDDTYEWTFVVRDAQGKAYVDYKGKHTRVK
jgi:hypothetical protein